MWAAITAIIQAILGALFSALRLRREDRERDAALREQAIDEAALETDEVINETADARAGLATAPSDPDALAGELRRSQWPQTPCGRAATRHRRPF